MTAKKTQSEKPAEPETKAPTLSTLERIILQAESSFIAKGDAFRQIRDLKLFEKSKDAVAKTDFGAYCARWDYSQSYISRLITGSVIAKMAAQMGFTVNEGQARELHGLHDNPEVLEDILNEATNQQELRLTAAAIRAARMKLAPPDVTDPNADSSSDPSEADTADPNDGENWPGVIAESQKAFARLVKEMPPEFCSLLGDAFDAARKKSYSKARRAGKLKEAA